MKTKKDVIKLKPRIEVARIIVSLGVAIICLVEGFKNHDFITIGAGMAILVVLMLGIYNNLFNHYHLFSGVLTYKFSPLGIRSKFFFEKIELNGNVLILYDPNEGSKKIYLSKKNDFRRLKELCTDFSGTNRDERKV
ncbi:MAG: hypothetical protein KC478_13365 [Bacteriovoracaceae bacterium]|nr:hypothetical protein [Bacteriovoracaceae bacterium]